MFRVVRTRTGPAITSADLADMLVLAETFAIAAGDAGILQAGADRPYSRDQELVKQDPPLASSKFRLVEGAWGRSLKNAKAVVAAATQLACFI